MTITFKVDNLNAMSANLRGFSKSLRESGIDEDAVFTCRLISCELLANIIRHGGETAEFTCEIKPDVVEMCFSADCQENIAPGNRMMPPPMAESGRGICIVNIVSEDGIEKGDNGVFKVCVKRTSS